MGAGLKGPKRYASFSGLFMSGRNQATGIHGDNLVLVTPLGSDECQRFFSISQNQEASKPSGETHMLLVHWQAFTAGVCFQAIWLPLLREQGAPRQRHARPRNLRSGAEVPAHANSGHRSERIMIRIPRVGKLSDMLAGSPRLMDTQWLSLPAALP